jgi:hypothetical protein
MSPPEQIQLMKMTKFKVQMSNQIQISNEMPEQVRHAKSVILNLALKQVQGLRFQNPVLNFDIGILTFGIYWNSMASAANSETSFTTI